MRWYVVHAYSGYEKKVALALKDRVVLHNMEKIFGDILVPTEEVVELKGELNVKVSVNFSLVMFLFKWN